MIYSIVRLLTRFASPSHRNKMKEEDSVPVRASIRAFENKQITLVGRHCVACGLDFFVPAQQSKALAETTLRCPDCGEQKNQLLFSLVVEKIHIVEPLRARAAGAELLAR